MSWIQIDQTGSQPLPQQFCSSLSHEEKRQAAIALLVYGILAVGVGVALFTLSAYSFELFGAANPPLYYTAGSICIGLGTGSLALMCYILKKEESALEAPPLIDQNPPDLPVAMSEDLKWYHGYLELDKICTFSDTEEISSFDEVKAILTFPVPQELHILIINEMANKSLPFLVSNCKKKRSYLGHIVFQQQNVERAGNLI